MPWQCRKCIEALAERCQERACTFSTRDSCAGVLHNDCLFQDFKGRCWEVCRAWKLWEACITLWLIRPASPYLFHRFLIIQYRHLQVYILRLPILYKTSHLQLGTFHSSR